MSLLCGNCVAATEKGFSQGLENKINIASVNSDLIPQTSKEQCLDYHNRSLASIQHTLFLQ